MNGRDPEQFPRPFTVGYDAETEEYYIFAPEGCVLVNGMAAAINGADASGNVIIGEPADYLWAHVKKATSGEGYEVFFDGSDTMANSKWDFRVARFGEEDNDGNQYDLATGVVNLGSSNEVNVDDKSIDWRTDRASQSAPEVKSLEIKGWKTQQSAANSLVTTLGLPAKAAESESEGGGESSPAPGSDKQIIIRNGVDGSLEYMDLGVADIIGGLVDVVGDGTLTIKQGSSTLGTFTANQATNTEVTIPAPVTPNDGVLSITVGNNSPVTFTANQATNASVTIPEGVALTDTDPSDVVLSTGTASAGISTEAARADHVHKLPTTVVDTENAQVIAGSKRFTQLLYVGNAENSGNSLVRINPAGSIGLYGSTPFLDFHYGNSSADFTSRIIEAAEGVIIINSPYHARLGQAPITDPSAAGYNALQIATVGALNAMRSIAKATVVPGQTSQVLTLYYTDGTYTAIEIPHGLKGNDGAKGDNGDTPEITATRNGENVNIYADGDLIATLSDGRTPVITATKSQGVTTIFVDGVAVAQVEDGTAVTPDLPDVDVVTGVSFSVSNGKLYSITSKQNLKTGNTSQSTAEVCDVGELDVVVSEVYSHLTHQFTNTRKRIKVLGTPVDATGQTPFTATPLSGE